MSFNLVFNLLIDQHGASVSNERYAKIVSLAWFRGHPRLSVDRSVGSNPAQVLYARIFILCEAVVKHWTAVSSDLHRNFMIGLGMRALL